MTNHVVWGNPIKHGKVYNNPEYVCEIGNCFCEVKRIRTEKWLWAVTYKGVHHSTVVLSSLRGCKTLKNAKNSVCRAAKRLNLGMRKYEKGD